MEMQILVQLEAMAQTFQLGQVAVVAVQVVQVQQQLLTMFQVQCILQLQMQEQVAQESLTRFLELLFVMQQAAEVD
jgi:hypothetical protein